MRYVLTEDARNDLIEIGDYIALDNIKAAENLILEFKAPFNRLVQLPQIGVIRPDLTDKDVRFWKVKLYLIVYKIKADGIIIVRVLSAYRDIATLLSDS